LLLDISAGGVLIETTHRLLPGTTVELQLDSLNGRDSARGQVTRCEVVSVRAGSISYRGAVSFERPVGSLQQLPQEYPVPARRGPTGTPYPPSNPFASPSGTNAGENAAGANHHPWHPVWSRATSASARSNDEYY
jgi:hypothetical protein